MKTKLGVGLMSGTSLDGLDICLTEYDFENRKFKILQAETVSYSFEMKMSLKNAINLSGEDLTKLDMYYGSYLGEKVLDFIAKNRIEKLCFIASHGHTVFHNPKMGFTLQIGNGIQIFKKTGIKTVYDFRTQDVVFGGQGAPLVPIGDEQLFSKYDACLNLGGFSNISFKKGNTRVAFDICPINIVLNRLAERLGKEFDKGGQIASSGKVNDLLLSQLNQLDFYQTEPPKSLGVEWCNSVIFPLLNDSSLNSNDTIATFTEHISVQVSKVLNRNSIQDVLITGGGAYNTYLIELIRAKTKAKIIIPEKEIIEFKESLIFGWMGLLKLENQINTLSSVTGADRDHSAGIVVG